MTYMYLTLQKACYTYLPKRIEGNTGTIIFTIAVASLKLKQVACVHRLENAEIYF